MATLVVLSTLRDSVIQERLSGNFQKKLNARLMAEKGVFASLEKMSEDLANNPTSTLDELLKNNQHQSGKGILASTAYNASISKDSDGNIIIASLGERYEGEDRLEAVFKYIKGASENSSPTPFTAGITGCSAAAVNAGGTIDSYDSSLADYNERLAGGERNISSEAFIHTLNETGTITISGGSPGRDYKVKGDVLAAGDLIIKGGSSVSGNIHSNGMLTVEGGVSIGGNATTFQSYEQHSGIIDGSITANAHVTLKQVPVGGSIYSVGPINVTGKSVEGNILSNDLINIERVNVSGSVTSEDKVTIIGNRVEGAILSGNLVTLKQTHILGGVKTYGSYIQNQGQVDAGVRVLKDVSFTQYGTTITNDDLRYAGIGSFMQWEGQHLANAPYKVPPSQIHLPVIPKAPEVKKVELGSEEQRGISTCDPLNISDEINNASSEQVLKDLYINNNSKEGDLLEFETTIADYPLNKGSTPKGPIASVPASFLGKPLNIFYFNNILIKGRMAIKENHNAVLYIDGDFQMAGASSLTIPDNSSLTIIIKGKLKISAGAQVYTPSHGITSKGNPVFSIYSSYDNSFDNGIEFSGGTREVYAAIYAPYANVSVTSAVGFKGAMLGNTVNVTGAGGIHYDKALMKVKPSNPPNITGTAGKFIFKEWRLSNEQD